MQGEQVEMRKGKAEGEKGIGKRGKGIWRSPLAGIADGEAAKGNARRRHLVVLGVLVAVLCGTTGALAQDVEPEGVVVLKKATTGERVVQATTLVIQPIYFAGRLAFALGAGIYGSAVWFSDEEKARQVWRTSLYAPWVWHVFATGSPAHGSENTPS